MCSASSRSDLRLVTTQLAEQLRDASLNDATWCRPAHGMGPTLRHTIGIGTARRARSPGGHRSERWIRLSALISSLPPRSPDAAPKRVQFSPRPKTHQDVACEWLYGTRGPASFGAAPGCPPVPSRANVCPPLASRTQTHPVETGVCSRRQRRSATGRVRMQRGLREAGAEAWAARRPTRGRDRVREAHGCLAGAASLPAAARAAIAARLWARLWARLYVARHSPCRWLVPRATPSRRR